MRTQFTIARSAGWFPAILPALLGLTLAAAEAQEWGDLKLRFVVGGAPPAAKFVKAGAGGCAPMVPADAFIVGEKGGIMDVIVYLTPAKDEKVAVHPDLQALPTKDVQIDNKACLFVPHVLLLRNGQSLTVTNSDPIGHSALLNFVANKAINKAVPPKDKQLIPAEEIAKPERLPTSIGCAIHPHMSAFVLVQNHPYMAISDLDGHVTVKNLPVGKHAFRVWHDPAYVTGSVGKERITKGKLEVEIASGSNDLGTCKIAPPKDS